MTNTSPLSTSSSLAWLNQAAATTGRTLHLALLLLSLCSTRGTRCLLLTRRMLASAHISRDAAYGALRHLQELGMVNVRRLPGRSPQVDLLARGTDRCLALHTR